MQVKKINFLSKKVVERIEKIVEKNYGVKPNFSGMVLATTGNWKIWLISKQIGEIDCSKLRINLVGLYFGRLIGKKIRLSIEGCQLIGNFAKKNFVILSKDEVEKFVKGHDCNVAKAINCEEENFVLVKYENDFLGIGKYVSGKIENLIPRSRRLDNKQKL